MNEGPENPAGAIGEAQAPQIGYSTGAVKHRHAAEIEIVEVRSGLTGNDRGDVLADVSPGLFGGSRHPR